MTAGELVLIVLAVLMILGFTGLIVVLLRVLDTLRSLRSEVTDLRDETRPLLADLRHTTNEARSTVDEARHDLERFDKVLGSAEAIGDAIGGRVTKTAFSSPAIKAAGFAKGTSRVWSRLRGGPDERSIARVDPNVIDVRDRSGVEPEQRRRKRA
jgi:Sec-independent protein translocase protein TatA